MINVASARVVLSGTMPGGEVWSAGFRTLALGSGGDSASYSTAAAAVLTQLNGAGGAALRALMATSTVCTKCTIYHIPASTDASDYQGEAAATIAGTGPAVHQNQAALVFTILSTVVGRRGRGRVFWPATGANVSTATAQLLTDPATAATAMVNLMRSPTGTTIPVVASPTAGTAAPATAIRLDSRLDVMRSRANKQLPIARAVVAIPT